MTRDLNDFLNNPQVLIVYLEDYGWGEEDYESDREQITYLLEKVERRRRSLEKYLKGQAEKRGSLRKMKSDTKATPLVQ